MTLSELVMRFVHDMASRPSGPLAFRFVLQPVVSAALAVRAGLRDAESGRAPYLFTIVRDPSQRRAHLREGWEATARVFALAAAMDVVYQLIVFKAWHPLETLVIAFALACLPYLLIRG